jgi:hypothetical protein
MSPTLATTAAPLRRVLATQRLAARAATALTLHAASVIVVSSTLSPARSRDEAHAHARSARSHTSEPEARTPTHYKLQSVAL